MIRRLLLLATFLLLPTLSFAQTSTVTGHILYPSGGASANGKACFTLQNFKPNSPRVSGTGVIVQNKNFCVNASSVDGSFSTTLYRNDQITPGSTYWRVDFLWNGQQESSANYNITTATYNLDTATPMVTTPLPASGLVTSSYNCQISSALSTWTCVHNFNDKNVTVTVYDLNGAQIFPNSLTLTDANTVTLTWITPQAGNAVIIHASAIAIAISQANAVLQSPAGAQTINSAQSLIINAPTTHTGNNTHSGTEAFKNVNAIQFVDQFPGPTTINKLDQCLALAAPITCWATTSLGAGNPTSPPAAGKTLLDFRSGSPYTFTTTGVYTNTQMDENMQILLGPVNPGLEYSSQQAGNFASDSLTGATFIPSTATVHQADGLAGYLINNSSAVAGVGIFGQSRASTNTGRTWGANTVTTDTACTIANAPTGATESGTTVTITCTNGHGFAVGSVVVVSGVGVGGYNGASITITAVPASPVGANGYPTTLQYTTAGGLGTSGSGAVGLSGVNLFGYEDDVNVVNAATSITGFNVNGVFSVVPAQSNGIVCSTVGTAKWGSCFVSSIGATAAPTGSGAAMVFAQEGTGASKNSQGITYQSTDAGSVVHVATENMDLNGNWQVNAPGQILSFSTAGLLSAPKYRSTGTGNGTSSPFSAVASGQVGYSWKDTSQALDAKLWDAVVGIDANTLRFRAVNDAEGSALGWLTVTRNATTSATATFSVPVAFPSNTAALTSDWTCGTAGTVSSCVAATIIGSGGGVPLTFTLPLVAQSYTLECDGVVGQATAVTANQWNLLTATNGATNVTANFTMATAATAFAAGAVTDQASTTTTFQIAPSWTLGGTATKMPFHIYAKIEGASASGTVVSLQLVAPNVADLVTIYRGAS